MVPTKPPSDAPEVALTIDYAERADAEVGPQAQVSDGRLVLHNPSVETPAGVPLSERPFRDTIVDARISLESGGEDTVYGVYVRQSTGTQYVAWGMSPTGRIVAGIVLDNQWNSTTDARLAPDLPFARGLGQANRFQVVALGPAIVYVLNGAIVTAATVDQRFQEGYCGFWLLRGEQSPDEARLAVDWVQVRAVLPGQRSGPGT